MNKTLHNGLAAALGSVLAGCATNPPLMFGDTTTFGLRLGNDTATGGASVSIGYKAQSIAVVPVSTIDDTGTVKLLKGHGTTLKERDALSVFASFQSAASAPPAGSNDSTVRLGQVFSTGLAAQDLTMGYLCRERNDAGCNKTAVDTALEAAAAANQAAALATAAAASANGATAMVSATMAGGALVFVQPPGPTPPVAADRPYQAPLVFLRTDLVGIDIGGSLAEKGVQFNLGYTNRNLALIPVYAAGPGGKVVGMFGDQNASSGTSDSPHDSYSVLGQFKGNTETTRLSFGLERYFATGIAARNLGKGMGAAIAKTSIDPALPAASAVAAAAARLVAGQ